MPPLKKHISKILGLLLVITVFFSYMGLGAAIMSFWSTKKVDFAWLAFYFPVFWVIWLLVYLCGEYGFKARIQMKLAWFVNALAILAFLFSLTWTLNVVSERSFLEVENIAAITFVPINIPFGLVPEIFISVIDKFFYGGKGVFYSFLRSCDISLYAFGAWVIYCFVGFLQTWALIFGGQYLRRRQTKENPG